MSSILLFNYTAVDLPELELFTVGTSMNDPFPPIFEMRSWWTFDLYEILKKLILDIVGLVIKIPKICFW